MQNNWAFQELYGVRLWDPRCQRTLVAACSLLAENSQLSFSQALGSRRKAVSRILHHPQVTPQGLLDAHIAATKHRAQQEGLLLIASDTTVLNFSSHPKTEGLGPISDQAHSLGFFVHSALALTPSGVPLGLLHQSSWARDPQQAGMAKARRQRAYTDKESHKWLEALRAVEKTLSASQKAVLIQDREADIFEFFSAPRKEGLNLLLRATQPRRLVTGEEADPANLFAAIAQAPVVATRTLHIPAGPKRVERDACLSVRATQVWVRPPRHGTDPNGPAMPLWVVGAFEENPPEGVKEPLEWVLLTTLAVQAAEEALRILDYYTLRWRIERFHFVLKSGCAFEKLQLDRLDTLQKVLSLYSIVAWRLLYVTYLAREAPDTPAEEVVSIFEKDVLERTTQKTIATVQEAVLAVARLVGFASLPSAPQPGVKTLWLGFRKLQDMTQGYLLARMFPQ